MQERENVKLYMHNLCGFDSHLIINEYKSKNNRILKAIPENTEKIKILKIGIFDILDSYSFQSESLSVLTEKIVKQKTEKKEKLALVANCHDLTWTKGKFDPAKYKLCMQKAPFAYHLATSINALLKIKKFPEFCRFSLRLMGFPGFPG